MSSNTNVVVASSDQDDFLTFQRDFEQNFKNLADALAKSKSVGSVASSVGKKGALSMAWGALNGSNDKEFAQMASDLAASLGTTQVVLQMVLQLSHRKNGFLRHFHQVLVNKISSLTSDTKTLDSNQRDATIVILQELDDHVSAQLAQHDMVDRHETRLESIDQYISAADVQVGELRIRLSGLGSVVDDLFEADSKLRVLVEAEQVRVDARIVKLEALVATQDKQIGILEVRADEQRLRIDEQGIRIDEQARRNHEWAQEMAGLKDLLATQKEQIKNLDVAVAGFRSARSVLLRNALALAALALAAISLLNAVPVHGLGIP